MMSPGFPALVRLPLPWLLVGYDGGVRAAAEAAGVAVGACWPLGPDGAPVLAAGGRAWRCEPVEGGWLLWAQEDGQRDGAAARFTAAVSHEIRTPLNGILGMAALLEESDLAPAQQAYVDAIRRSGARLLDLLNNVLDYSRLEADALPLESTPFDPGELVQETVELLAPRAHAAGVDLAARVEAGLPARFIGDAGRVRQILFNLTGNAVKFSPRGEVLVEARRGEGGAGIRLVVSDTGEGIPEDAGRRVFEAFGQAQAADSRRDGGAGLGLAICARLVQAMGGAIGFQSVEGEGSAFAVDLPLAASPAPQGRVRPPAGLEGRRVKLVLPAASTLACASALAAADASPVVGQEDADIAILDAALPPQRIGAEARQRPVLVALRPEDRARIPAFRELGGAGYLIRPLRASSIVDRVRFALAGERDAGVDADAGPDGAGRRVLIADDNAVNALLAKSALAAAGFRVDTAATGAEALEAAGETLYDLVLMDIRMPVMDGLEATRRIRSLEGEAGATPVVALTADIDPDLETRARAAGVNAIAAKPIDPARLRALAAVWAADRTGTRAAAE